MTEGRHPGQDGKVSQPKTVMVQVFRPGDDSPLKFPALVRNLADGVATLEVDNPWTVLDWGSLKGQAGSLHLMSANGAVTELQGRLNWARYTVTDRDSGQLSLGLQLTALTAAARQLLDEQMLHTSEDIKTLWDRWEEARRAAKPPAFSPRLGFLALALLGGSLAVNRLIPGPYKWFSWILWLSAALVVAAQTRQFWKNRRDYR